MDDEIRRGEVVSNLLFQAIDDLQLQVTPPEFIDPNPRHQDHFPTPRQFVSSPCCAEPYRRDSHPISSEVGLNVLLLIPHQTRGSIDPQPFDTEDRLAISLAKGSQPFQLLRQLQTKIFHLQYAIIITGWSLSFFTSMSFTLEQSTSQLIELIQLDGGTTGDIVPSHPFREGLHQGVHLRQ